MSSSSSAKSYSAALDQMRAGVSVLGSGMRPRCNDHLTRICAGPRECCVIKYKHGLLEIFQFARRLHLRRYVHESRLAHQLGAAAREWAIGFNGDTVGLAPVHDWSLLAPRVDLEKYEGSKSTQSWMRGAAYFDLVNDRQLKPRGEDLVDVAHVAGERAHVRRRDI
jgi:hypothetical protein